MQTPHDYGLAYEDLTLDTIDGIKVKCYLMLQRRELETDSISTPPLKATDEEVRKDFDTNFSGGGGGKYADTISLSVIGKS